MSPQLKALFEAADNLGAWLSAALDDEQVCDAMKADIAAWFSALMAAYKEYDYGQENNGTG